MIAGVSSGIEPIFAGVFQRNVLGGAKLQEVHPAVRKLLSKRESEGALSEADLSRLLGPAWQPAYQVSVEGHLQIQAAFQRHSDSAVSKTINLPQSASVDQVEQAYRRAYLLGCKGITVYRDQSRPSQVLELKDSGSVATANGQACENCDL
jgi:ribonucleoside-diphosphate reductase alpha chain